MKIIAVTKTRSPQEINLLTDYGIFSIGENRVQELMDKITEGAKDLGFIPVAPETQEKTANPELKVVVDKALKDLDKKRTLSKVKESVKSKLKANTEKAEQAPKKSRTSKAKEERA